MAPDPSEHVVLLVHGVGHRDRTELDEVAAMLGERLAPREIVPVFWGDLGPHDVEASLPSEERSRAIDGAAVDAAVADTADRIAADIDGDVPAETVAVMHDVLADAAASGVNVERPEVHEALADAVVLTEPAGTADLPPDTARGRVIGSVRDRWRRLVDAVDARFEQMSPETLMGNMRRTVARAIRDVEVYENNGDLIRSRFDDAYSSVLGAERVDVLAHSLGSLIAVEYLLGAPAGANAVPVNDRRVHTMVTFGSQISLFAGARGLRGSAPSSVLPHMPLDIAVAVERWFNVWHMYDPLAFALAPTLRVHGPEGDVEIEELHLELGGFPSTASFHTSYWRDERFVAWLTRTL